LRPPATFDDFLTAAKKLTDSAKNQYGFSLRGGAGGQDQWLVFMVIGARLAEAQGEVMVNNADGVKANQWCGLQTFMGEFIIQWDLLTAGGVITALPIVFFFLLVQRQLIAGLTAGAVKG
jgi:hypothetical protein